MTTISDIAKKASVGVGTVSRVLSGKGSVSDATRRRVLQVMSELNYRPNSIARSLAMSQTNSIGIMVPEFHGRYFGSLLTAAESNLRDDGRYVMVASGAGDETEELATVEHLQTRECDGLILYSTEMTDETLVALIRSSPKIALLNRIVEDVADHCFNIDYVLGGALVAQYFLAAGHTKFACITGPRGKRDAIERQSGFESELAKAGIDLSTVIKVEGAFSYETGAICMEQLWHQNAGQFTAMFCGNDEMAVGAMFKLIELGGRVPDDVSIVGFDDAPLASYTYPKLTTIRSPMADVVSNAASYIRNLCYKQNNKVQNSFVPELVERDSVRKVG